MKVTSTPNAPAAIGPYSQAVAVNGFLFTSGQIAVKTLPKNVLCEIELIALCK